MTYVSRHERSNLLKNVDILQVSSLTTSDVIQLRETGRTPDPETGRVPIEQGRYIGQRGKGNLPSFIKRGPDGTIKIVSARFVDLEQLAYAEITVQSAKDILPEDPSDPTYMCMDLLLREVGIK